jgi:hypothetical protein
MAPINSTMRRISSSVLTGTASLRADARFPFVQHGPYPRVGSNPVDYSSYV